MQVTFRVHGSGGKLFGDGIGIWYTRDRGVTGPVFGSMNNFSGLGVFIDTYNNEYKSYAVSFVSLSTYLPVAHVPLHLRGGL